MTAPTSELAGEDVRPALVALVESIDAFLAGESKTDRVMPERMRTAYRNAKTVLSGGRGRPS